MREHGRFYFNNSTGADNREQFKAEKARQNAKIASPTRLDNSCKWQSTLKMAQTHGPAQPITEKLGVNCGAKVPSSLTAAEEALKDEALAVLEMADATLSQMQRDDSLLAEYWPLREAFAACLRESNSEFALAWLRELEAAEARHMDKPLGLKGSPGARWKNLRELVQVAAFAHPRYRRGLWMADVERRQRLQRSFAQHCLAKYAEKNQSW